MERSIGERVRILRERAGLSRDDMAARMGLTTLQLRKLEDATNIIPVAHLAAAARVLDVSVATFYGPYDPLQPGRDGPAAPAVAPPDDPDIPALISAYEAAPDSVRQSFVSLLKSLSRR
jgi:transcriptional regulator with XRE-family HTH domain